ncbi:thiamine diphosphate-binding protein [Hyaloscypha finlandica]|nr:thiamine diphosphate-binding protein [Hyaloscypha finlandica]
MSTTKQFNIGVKMFVLNNEEQGMVAQWQNIFYEDRYSHTHSENPNFMKLADAMGIQARRVVKPDDVRDALKWLVESDGPAFLEGGYLHASSDGINVFGNGGGFRVETFLDV